MNKDKIFLIFGLLGGLGLLGVFIIMIFRPDATATAIAFVVQILGIATAAAVTVYMLGKSQVQTRELAEEVQTIKSNTNGNLSRLMDIIDAKDATIASLNSPTTPGDHAKIATDA